MNMRLSKIKMLHFYFRKLFRIKIYFLSVYDINLHRHTILRWRIAGLTFKKWDIPESIASKGL